MWYYIQMHHRQARLSSIVGVTLWQGRTILSRFKVYDALFARKAEANAVLLLAATIANTKGWKKVIFDRWDCIWVNRNDNTQAHYLCQLGVGYQLYQTCTFF